MKKLFVAVALAMGFGTSAVFAINHMNINTEIMVVADEYVEIEVKDVPQAIQDVIAKNYERTAIKEAYMKTGEDEAKVYKLVLINGDETETIILFNEKGEEVK